MYIRNIIITLAAGLLALPLQAQQSEAAADTTRQEASAEHVELMGVRLNAAPQQLIEQMEERDIRLNYTDSAKQTHYLDGMLGAMEITVEIRCNKPMTQINLVRFSTASQRNQHEDYATMMRWLRMEYGDPDWQGTVRSHRFARWFTDFDRDIILIATGDGAVETWFYENHQQRNIDYYSILKYCEKYPSDNVPFLTAAESVTWKRNDSIVVVRRHVATRHKRRAAVRKRHAPARRKTAKRRRRR